MGLRLLSHLSEGVIPLGDSMAVLVVNECYNNVRYHAQLRFWPSKTRNHI